MTQADEAVCEKFRIRYNRWDIDRAKADFGTAALRTTAAAALAGASYASTYILYFAADTFGKSPSTFLNVSLNGLVGGIGFYFMAGFGLYAAYYAGAAVISATRGSLSLYSAIKPDSLTR